MLSLYIAVHKCQPYCLQCSDQSICTQWNSTYDSNIVKFSQAECSINQYYDEDSVGCLDCTLSCLTCTSKIDCQTCQSTYTLTKLGCVCNMNQYEESNQCYDCPNECSQCLSSTYCIECLVTNNRQLQNGQCNCIDGYYPNTFNLQCQTCHQFCKTCTGPTSNECLTCENIVNIENQGPTTCRCPIGSSYQDIIKTCSICHSSCQTCFRTAIDGCLTCEASLNRILKGLRCECAPGYYELNNICTNCPITEDITLSKCYKLCNTNQYIWHTITCNSCDIGYQLVSGECEPICGDLSIKGYEQCEDNNSLIDDLCYNCQYQCPPHSLTCDQQTTLPWPDICGDEYITGIEECEDGNTIQYDGCYDCMYQCQPQCTKCIKGECFECVTAGWFIDPSVTPWQCKERCGDMLIVGSEQCEDGNTSDTDGCKDCKYFCRIGCSSCNYTTNTCLSCELPGFFPQSYYCRNICGDGLVVSDPSGNDGCGSTCQFQCQQSSICTNCVNNRCELCASGYFLTSNQICIPICGDYLQVTSKKCEVSLILLPNEGCWNCIPKCQTSCVNCNIVNGNGCLLCKTGYKRIDNLCYLICGDRIVTDDEQCDDGNLILGDGCHFCQYSCQDSCKNCIQGVCYDCQDGYELIQFKCYPVCGNQVQNNNEQCEIIDQSISEGCVNCVHGCDMNCQICLFGKCYNEKKYQLNFKVQQLINVLFQLQLCQVGFDISPNTQICQKQYQQEDNQIEYCKIQVRNICIVCQDLANLDQIQQTCILQYKKCGKNCKFCLDQVCLECHSGQYGSQCTPQLGDSIVVEEEICYDLNKQNVYDSIECYSNCDISCINCINGKCDLCLQGFYLFNNECIQNYIPNILYVNYDLDLCGDDKISINEECEDNNTNQFDGCYQCKFLCDSNCINCQFGKCQGCILGYIVNTNYMCEPECGDGILIPFTSEQCDDQSDGCFNCQFKCQPYCLQYGFQPNLNECIPICGDGILQNNLEECDDQNDEQFDGCFECQFQCQAECTDCQFGVCQMCEISGWQLQRNLINLMISNNHCIPLQGDEFVFEEFEENDDRNDLRCGENQQLVNYLCVNLCGNGLLSNQHEECDDGNHQGGDGCSSFCHIEDQYQCLNQQGSLSQCTYMQAPDFNMNILSEKGNSTQIVELTFNQEVKLKEQLALENFINFQIIPQAQYKMIIKNISSFMTNLNKPKYQIQIEFIEPIQNPVLQVDVERDIIYNQFDIGLQSNQQIINLGTPFVLQQATKKQLASVSQLNDAMMYYSMASVSGLALVTGNSIMFFNLLDLLQSLSYLRFMSYQFPPHLYAFLDTYTKVSLQPILNYFQVDQLLEKLNNGQKQNQVDGKSHQDAQSILNQLYLFNAKSCYLSVFASILTYLICCLLVSKSANSFVHQLTYKYQNNSNILKLLNIFQRKVQQNCLILKIEYFSFGIQKIFQATLHQMIFSLTVQFPYYPFNSTIEIISSINAIFGLLYIIRAIYPVFSITSSQIKNQNKWKYFYYESKATFWACQFKSLSIFRILFYIIIIVKLINYPEAQSILLSMQSTFFVIYLIKFKPLKSKFELSKIICRELLFLFITVTFLLYSFQLSQDNLITIGWFHIGMFCTMLASNLFIDLFEQVLKLYDSYLQKQQKLKMMEESKYYFNRLQGYQ